MKVDIHQEIEHYISERLNYGKLKPVLDASLQP